MSDAQGHTQRTKHAVLLGAGIACAGAATYFYKRRQTFPFKVAYFMTWPVLGSAILLTLSPSEEGLRREMENSGISSKEIEEHKEKAAQQLKQLRQLATKND